MKTKIRILIVLVLFSAASLMVLFGSPSRQPGGDPRTESDVSVPSIISTSSDNGGMRTRADTLLPSVRYRSQIDLNQPSVTLEQVDGRSLTLEANQIGINRSVEVSPNTRAQKFINSDGSEIIVLIIKSSGASGIGVHFRDFALTDGEEVYVYGTAPDSTVFGPFTDKGPWGSGEFWSGTVDGDTAVIEFYKRNGESGQGFEIFEVSHTLAELDWRLRSNEPDVLDCEVDASCNPVNENNAVARITFMLPNGKFVCTGTLLNDVAHDQTPYFLTANHCVNSQAVAQTVEVYWFYQTTSCNSGVLRNGIVHQTGGATFLSARRSSDFCLLRLQNNAPGGVVFSGWTSARQRIGTSVFGLHHPDNKIPPVIDSYLRKSGGSITGQSPVCQATGLSGGYTIDWTVGVVEAGSSGSGLFNSDTHQLVGVLSCGPDACSPRVALYGSFSSFYLKIQQYIGLATATLSSPIANPATFVGGNSFVANWRRVSGATGYKLDVATDNSFTHYVAGYQDRPVGNVLSGGVAGLNANTTYYYRVRANDGNVTSGNSNVVSVTTFNAVGAPFVVTNQASNITRYGARLNGAVNPHGFETTVYFEYGTTTNYGSRSEPENKTGNNFQNVFENTLGLRPGTTYHFRVVASNVRGTRRGNDRTFTTTQ